MTPDDVARITRIPLKTITAIEAGRLEELPAPAILRGFIIAYCRTVRCDETRALEMFAGLVKRNGENIQPKRYVQTLLISDRRSPPMTWTYLAIVMVFVIGIIVAMVALGTRGQNGDLTRSGGLGLRDVPEVVDR